jgi:sulfur carrier protein ThiS adenylyltransferase
MNKFEEARLEELGAEAFRKIRSVKIGVAGAGGLGSNCLMNLVRSGFQQFKVVDPDKIDHANLNRQFYFYSQVGEYKVEAVSKNLNAINPDIEIETICEYLTPENSSKIFRDCDIIIEALDKAETKSMFISKVLDKKKLIISASGLSGYGNSDDIKVSRIKDNFYIVGDQKTDCKEAPPVSPRVNIAAAKQADIVLAYVLTKQS